MEIKIDKCNNIEKGKIDIEEGALNVKYGVNGTGKSTVSKALDIFISNKDKNQLIPFKYRKNPKGNLPSLTGYETFKSISIFNEEYVNNYVFLPDELLKNSFEIFVKTKDYDAHINEIENLIREITDTFSSDSEVELLISTFQEFVSAFGKAASGYSKAGAIEKGIGKGNKVENIPKNLKEYEPYLINEKNVSWLKWQSDGKNYIEITDKCPYCLTPLGEKKSLITELNEHYNSKDIDNLNKIIELFETFKNYLTDADKKEVSEILKNASNISTAQIEYLVEIKNQVIGLIEQLYKLRSIGFFSLKNVEKIADELKKYIIDTKYYSHLNSKIIEEKVSNINEKLNNLLTKAGQLQGEISKQKSYVKKTIEAYNKEIDDFLFYAGYKYKVTIIDATEKVDDYKLVLKHIDSEEQVSSVKEHLSYGERNAFSLVLFMYSTLKENPDIIVLDDPISSFDGNKKYAIINMLFRGTNSFKNRTVLLFTHEFGSVIDIIYNLYHKFSPKPNAKFINNVDGILDEKKITKYDIKSFIQIANENIQNSNDNLNKLIYLRRLIEFIEPNSLAWQLLSNIFHKREVPLYKTTTEERAMTPEEIVEASNKIREYINDFDYKKEYDKTQDNKLLKTLYENSSSNYEKLQIYRVIFNENHENDVIRKFVNETFHIENDYLFQLNPREYDTVPQYIIDICNQELKNIK